VGLYEQCPVYTLLNENVSHFYFFRAMTTMKARLKGAQKGHSLLKKKSDALTMRFRKILKTIIDVSLVLLNSK